MGVCPPPLSKLVVPGSSTVTMHTVAVRSLEGKKWVVWHAETKGSIVASVQSGACSLSYPTSNLHLCSVAVGPGWRNVSSCLSLGSLMVALDLPLQTFSITLAYIFISLSLGCDSSSKHLSRFKYSKYYVKPSTNR